MKISKSLSEKYKNKEVEIYTIDNQKGLEISLMTQGATLISLQQADRNGDKDEITLSFDKPADYVKNRTFYGASIGRFGNRIAKGKFNLNGEKYTLATNNGPNHLHGGLEGFDRQIWEAAPFEEAGKAGVLFSRTSIDGEEGYPGNLKVEIKYTLTEEDRFEIEYKAVTDAETIINLTNHTYWNLAGAGSGPVSDQTFQSPADRFIPVNDELIPLGELRSVESTPFDFREEKTFGKGFQEVEESDAFKKAANPVFGFDHCFVLPEAEKSADTDSENLKNVGTVMDKKSGRKMEVRTNQPGFQLYTCGKMTDTKIANGRVAGSFGAFCLETQNFPDAPNQPNFPSSVLKPGETYFHKTVHIFSVEK
ncbi:MAG: galactose mutarotase [Spirochaetales bacterium]|nr:galactose mutarotase [Spirochaetales bacterium]